MYLFLAELGLHCFAWAFSNCRLGAFHCSGPLNWIESLSVVSNSLRPHGLYSLWNSTGQNTEVGSHFLLQGTFPTQGSNPGIPHCRQILYQLSHKGSTLPLSNSSLDLSGKYFSKSGTQTTSGQQTTCSWPRIRSEMERKCLETFRAI